MAAYGLLMDLYTSGQAGIKAGTIPADMSFHCDNEWDYVTNQPTTGTNFSHDSTYTVRSWQGLTAYLLRSYQFMYMPN